MPYSVRKGTGKDKGKKCVYKKGTDKKVGCTNGPIKDYLAALHVNANESLKMTKTRLLEIIKEEVSNIFLEEGLNPSKIHVFKKLKSGDGGKVYVPNPDDAPPGHIVIKPNTNGFPYDNHGERQETLDTMSKT